MMSLIVPAIFRNRSGMVLGETGVDLCARRVGARATAGREDLRR